MSNEMARKIKNLRQQRGMTLEQVADIVGVGKSTVRKWETGMIANMKRDKIASLAKALGTTPEYLMGWGEDVKPSDPKDAMFSLEEAQNLLMSQEAILFDGEPMDDETRELLLISLKNTMILAEKLSKKRKK